jgi:hypothetical protein
MLRAEEVAQRCTGTDTQLKAETIVSVEPNLTKHPTPVLLRQQRILPPGSDPLRSRQYFILQTLVLVVLG